MPIARIMYTRDVHGRQVSVDVVNHDGKHYCSVCNKRFKHALLTYSNIESHFYSPRHQKALPPLPPTPPPPPVEFTFPEYRHHASDAKNIHQLLVFGCLREWSKIEDIPTEIALLIMEYERYYDEWHEKCSSKEVRIQNNKQCVAIATDARVVVYATEIKKNANYSWRLQVVKGPPNGYFFHVYIGLIANNAELMAKQLCFVDEHGAVPRWHGKESGFMWSGYYREVWGFEHIDSSETTKVGTKFQKEGDIVELKWVSNGETKEANVSLSVNNVDHGVIVQEINPELEYRFAMEVQFAFGVEIAFI